MPPAITLQNASVGYGGVSVFSNLSLTINIGERVAILGRSGAGKSTLMNYIYSRFPQDAALVPQASALVSNLSVFHNVFMGRLDRHSTLYNLRTLAWPSRSEIEAVTDMLSAVGLVEKLFAKAGELSGGQQQRTSIARALFNGRPVIIGDEPVSALDRVQAGEMLKLLSNRHQTAVFALHDIRLALEHTDRIVLLERGTIALDLPATSLSPDKLLPYFEGELE
jgi:phosphonate transport system ATP-binding protein